MRGMAGKGAPTLAGKCDDRRRNEGETGWLKPALRGLVATG